MFRKILKKLGLIKKSDLDNNLNYARSVAKRLDEHRELVENLEESGFFKDYFWHIGHVTIQDDYLMRLYFMVHGRFPSEQEHPSQSEVLKYGYVRKRPAILGKCNLPEYSSQVNQLVTNLQSD